MLHGAAIALKLEHSQLSLRVLMHDDTDFPCAEPDSTQAGSLPLPEGMCGSGEWRPLISVCEECRVTLEPLPPEQH